MSSDQGIDARGRESQTGSCPETGGASDRVGFPADSTRSHRSRQRSRQRWRDCSFRHGAAAERIRAGFEERLERARRDLTPDYFKLFDGYVVDDHQALLADPSDIEAKVDFVTTYHMVIEGTLALTGQYFQTSSRSPRCRVVCG
jgi:hypothetical protein